MTGMGLVKVGGSVDGQFSRGRIACRSALAIVGTMVQGAYQPVVHSDDPRAATCPECLETEECKKALATLAERVPTPAR